MKSDFFISDLHLHEEADPQRALFFELLGAIRSRLRSLFILGDFFEYWINDRHRFVEGYQPVISALRDLVASGISITFLHGNRDFMLGSAFARDLGVRVVDDPLPIRLGGRPVLVTHGDLLCTRDVAYQRVRRVLRFPPVRTAFRSVPIRLGRPVANGLRLLSRRETQRKSEDPEIMRAVPAEIDRRLEDVEVLVHGHVHRPLAEMRRVGDREREYYVLGSWEGSGTFIEHHEGQFSLCSFTFGEAATPSRVGLGRSGSLLHPSRP